MHPGRASRQPWRVTDKLTDAPPRRRSNQTGLVAPTPVPPGAEYKWLQLHEAWQKAFREPLQKAIDVYVDHDAVEPVQLGAMIPPEKVLPSRFVLTNKLPSSRPGGRWRDHMDREARQPATEAPTASLVAHSDSQSHLLPGGVVGMDHGICRNFCRLSTGSAFR